MNELLIRFGVFLTIGVGIWALSLKFRLKDYGPQPIYWVDGLFLALSMAIIAGLDSVLTPLSGRLLAALEPVSWEIHSFFSTWNGWLQVLAFLLLGDFLSYWGHRFLHSPLMWRFHAFHHSPKSLNWVSGMRASPVHFVVTLFPTVLAGMLILSDSSPAVLGFLLLGDALVQHLLHSGLALPFPSSLEKIVVTPRMHFVHHHPNPIYTNSNYGFSFSWWDRMFGTFSDPDQVAPSERGQLGLDYEQDLPSMFIGLWANKATEPAKNERASA